jgi:hypothetical protein
VAVTRLLVALTLCLAAAGCSSPTAASVGAASSAASGTPSPTTNGPTTEEWCTAYSTLTTSLAQASPDAAGASAALDSLVQFDRLWVAAADTNILTPEEAAANTRAVASYRAVLQAAADGQATDSPAMASARAALTAQTDDDRTVLTSSAGKVLALCGAVTESPSP